MRVPGLPVALLLVAVLPVRALLGTNLRRDAFLTGRAPGAVVPPAAVLPAGAAAGCARRTGVGRPPAGANCDQQDADRESGRDRKPDPSEQVRPPARGPAMCMATGGRRRCPHVLATSRRGGTAIGTDRPTIVERGRGACDRAAVDFFRDGEEGPGGHQQTVSDFIYGVQGVRCTRDHGSMASSDKAPARRISARISAVAESATLAIDAKAKALQAAGEDVVGFGVGEPDFPTPPHIVEAAVEACRDPKNHRYTPAPGLPELRQAVAAKTARDTGYTVEAAQVIVTNGGKQAVLQAFETLLDPGDEVLMPAPYWTTYPEAIRLAGGLPVEVPTTPESGYKVSLAQLEEALTPRTKVLLFVSPSNPTGAVYDELETAAIGAWADERGLWVITDEIYEHLVYGCSPDVLDAGARAGASRPLHSRERRGQDVRDDGVAGWLAHRSERCG